jgi:hypothetical protein
MYLASQRRNQKGNLTIPTAEWKQKHQIPKLMRLNKSKKKMETYFYKFIP